MSIRVQCGGCGSVMNVRDEYAGTERRCPKCKGKFVVPAASPAEPAAVSSGASPRKSIAGDDFDPVAFLTGKQPLSKSAEGSSPAVAKSKESSFDPMDVLSAGGPKKPAKPTPAGKVDKPRPAAPPTAKAESPASPPPMPGAAETPAEAAPEFDPLDVLGADTAAKPAPAGSPAGNTAAAPPPASTSPSGVPEKPQPRRPSWAKAAPVPEKNDWDDPPPPAPPPEPAALPPAPPEKPQPKRPSWAKAAPTPEKNDWDDPPAAAPAASTTTAAAAPSAAPALTSVAADASPAAQAAAAAMGETIGAVSSDNPALQAPQPRQPWINPAAIVAGFRRRLPLMLKTVAASLLLFGFSWWFVQPRKVEWKQIGTSHKLVLVPVSGRVTVDGQPLAGARVMFHPRGPQFRTPEGQTDSDGQFQLVFCEGYRGAPAGRYRVQLQLIGQDGTDGGTTADLHLRERTFEVPPGGGAVVVAIDTKAKPD